MTKVKICGMTRATDIEMARSADYLGFVVGSRSPRNLGLDVAKRLMSTTDCKKVMVTTTADPDQVVEMAHYLEPDVVQVHNLMGPADLRKVADGFSGSVWALAPVGGGAEDERLSLIRGSVHAIVLDTMSPDLGGAGATHDWTVSRRLRDAIHPSPVVLAGGLNTENVIEAIRTVMPFAVDVSSGVERQGLKDPELVQSYIRRAKEALE